MKTDPFIISYFAAGDGLTAAAPALFEIAPHFIHRVGRPQSGIERPYFA